MKKHGPLLIALIFFHLPLWCQGGLLDLIETDKEETVYTTASFKTNRVINQHSIVNTYRGVLDVKIGHRFGFINGGIRTFFGLDNATVRLGADYGLTDHLQMGLGRSSFQKTVDGYAKYRLLRQSTGAREMPLTLSLFTAAAIRTDPWEINGAEVPVQSRLNYTFQLIAGRKFSDFFSLQLSPTLVHRNLVPNDEIAHDVIALGSGARFRLSRRVTLNLEYHYVFPDQLEEGFRNSASVGLDIETGGHVFQLHFTNSTAMIEHGFITQTTGDWAGGGVHFGFNIARVFTIVRPELPE